MRRQIVFLTLSDQTTKSIMFQTRNKTVCVGDDWKFIGKQTVVKFFL